MTEYLGKIKDNIGLANRFLEEDLEGKREELVYLDFLIALHHSLRDLDYFNFHGEQGQFSIDVYSKAPFWLSLLDLIFFYHFDRSSQNPGTFMPQENNFKQNFLALNLIISTFIQKKFQDNRFNNTLHKHLFLSLYRIYDDRLLSRLLSLSELQADWSGLVKEAPAHLNAGFLETSSLYLKEWVEKLTDSSPGIIKMIEKSAQETEQATITPKGGLP